MNRTYRMTQRRGGGHPLARVSLVLDDDGSVTAGVCAGGNREAVGPQGTAPAGEAAILTQAVAYNEAWELPDHPLAPEQIAWLSSDDLKLMVQNISFALGERHDFLEGRLTSSRTLDGVALRNFFLNDYLKCMALLSELDYRLNKL